MNPLPISSRLRVGALALALVGLPTEPLLHAQAGISGNALGGQSMEGMRDDQKFDKGFQSKSALGQLEELTGASVDRTPANSYQPKAPKPHYNANQAFKNELAGAMVGMLFEAVFSDDSAKRKAQAEAAAAQAAQAAALAAAQAEAQRVQKELERQARIRTAQHYRADWDARESETDRQLGGVFDVPSTGTAFFGESNRIDPAVLALIDQGTPTPAGAAKPTATYPDVGDPSVVDLGGGSLVVQPLRGAQRAPAGAGLGRYDPTWLMPSAYEPPRARESESLRKLKALVDYFGPVLGDWYWETVIKGTAKATLWGAAKNLPWQEKAKALYDFKEQKEGLTEDLKESYDSILEHGIGDSDTLVRNLVAPGADPEFSRNYWEDLANKAAKARTEFYRLAIGQGFSKAELDLGETGVLGGDD